MVTKRELLLREIGAWRAEGVIDAATETFLRSRYANAPRSDELDGELHAGGGAASAAAAPPPLERRSFAADSMQFVGGLLLGAGLVALVVFLDLEEGPAAFALLFLGALLAAPAALVARRGTHPGLVEAGLSGGLVPMLVAIGISMELAGTQLWVPLVVAAVCVGVVVLREGVGPSILVASGGFAWAIAATTLLRENIFFGEPDIAARWAWFLSLCAFGVLLAVWRGRLWTEVSLAALVAPATFAFAMLLQPLSLTTLGMQLALAAWLAPVLAGGIFARSKGLVTGAAAGLTIDAVAFAFEIGGPGTAVVVLLVLGGLLVWQAEALRRYFRGRPS